MKANPEAREAKGQGTHRSGQKAELDMDQRGKNGYSRKKGRLAQREGN